MFNYLTDIRLSTKALLATIIPFLVNVAWLVAMWGNSVQIQELSVKEKAQSDFVESVNEFTQQYYQVQGAFVGAFTSVNSQQLQLFNENSELFSKQLQIINADPRLQDNQRAILTELANFSKSQKVILEDAYSYPDEDKWHRFVRFRRSVLHTLKANSDDKRDVREFTLPQRLELERLRHNQDYKQKIFLILLICGVSANFIVAIFVHFAYGRYITSRIGALVANAKALSQKGTMLTPLAGRDDFAIVDEALHESARQIDNAFSQKQALMQMIAHDLKSPLSASQVALETMIVRDKDSLTEAGLKTVNRVTGNNMRLLALINDLLTIDALELGHLDLTIQPEQVSQCVSEAIETLSASASAKNVTIETTVGDDVGLFDYRRVLQVVVNLLSNAIKFSENNSSIIVACDKTRGGKLKVSVIDTGKGIAKKDQPLLFQKYFQTEEGKRASGTGLGLAISKLIIDAHEEKIGFESAQSKGSTFWFTLADGEAD